MPLTNPTYEVAHDNGSHVWVRETFDLNAPNCPGILFMGGRPEPLPTERMPARFMMLTRREAVEMGLVAA